MMGGSLDNWNQGSLGAQTSGYTQAVGQGMSASDMARLLERQCAAQSGVKVLNGSKPLVVCGGIAEEAKDMDDAQRIAEERAHSKTANAYILKPVRMVAPKRDVVTTDLP